MGGKALFESNLAGWIIAGISAIGGVLIAVDQFRFAEITWLFAALWSLGWLWFQPYRSERFDVSIILIIVTIGLTLTYFTEKYRITKILSENHGLLIAADDPIQGCEASSDYKTVIIGGMSFATNGFPRDIIAGYDKAGSDPIPILGMNLVNGSLAISAIISSSDGRVISELKENNWVVNPNNVLEKENEDLSSLRVTDQFGDISLDVRFC